MGLILSGQVQEVGFYTAGNTDWVRSILSYSDILDSKRNGFQKTSYIGIIPAKIQKVRVLYSMF